MRRHQSNVVLSALLVVIATSHAPADATSSSSTAVSLVGRFETRLAQPTAVFNVQTTRISVATDGTQANALSRSPAISADGRYVVFVSYASNLAPGATAGQPNLFLRDTQSNRTMLIASESDLPRITPDGRYVSYRTRTDARSLQVLDRLSGTTIVLPSTDSISDDFRYAASGSPGPVSVLDRQTGQTTTVASGGNDPILSGDGRLVAFSFPFLTSSNRTVAQIVDLSTGVSVYLGSGHPRAIRANRYVLVDSDPEAYGRTSSFPANFVADRVTGGMVVSYSSAVAASASGRYLGYVNVPVVRANAYVSDQQTRTLLRVNAPASGGVANGDTSDLAIDDAGRTAFTSSATNLVDGDTNGAADVFLTTGGIDGNLPTEPRGLLASVTASGSTATVDLSWLTPADGGVPTGYVVEAGSVAGSSDLANFFAGLGTSLRANVPLGRRIFVRVRASNGTGVSVPSNEVTFTAGGGSPPGPPSMLSVDRSLTSVTLNWVAPTTGDRPVTYVIQAGSSSGASNLGTVTTRSSETSYSAQLPDGGDYFVRVQAVNSAGTGPPSNETSFSASNPPFCFAPQSPPTALSTSASGSTVTLNFDGISGSSFGPSVAYVAQAGTIPGSSDIGTFAIGSSVPVTIPNVPAGTYYVRVRGQSCGIGPVSNEAVVTVR